MNKAILINVDHLESSFKKRLDDEYELRIILSGAYGTGKTSFIKHFFQKHNEFVHIHLFPVNYSVAKNEDILELIKYDILYELVKSNPPLETIDTNWFESIGFLTGDDIYEILSQFLGMIPQVGKDIQTIIDGLKNIAGVFEKGKAETEETEIHKIIKYVKQTESSKGNIYENDFYTKLIATIVNRQKKDDRKVILTIDDLDRIDPEHVFRILNIFAAHFDIEENTNKFDIDRIVLVCDIENIKRIFKNKYGGDVDFSGYVNKFFSKGIFSFDNRRNTENFIADLIGSIKFEENQFINYIFFNGRYNEIAKQIIVDLVKSESINYRDLFRFFERQYSFREIILRLDWSDKIANWQLPILTVFEFLIDLLGGKHLVMDALNRTSFSLVKENFLVDRFMNKRYLGDLMLVSQLPYLKLTEIEMLSPEKRIYSEGISGKNEFTVIPSRVKYNGRLYMCYVGDFNQQDTIADISPELIKQVLQEAFRVYLFYRN